MNYYYLDAENRPIGPLNLDDIRRQAGTGRVPANPLVAREGAGQWQPLENTSEAAADAAFQFAHALPGGVAQVIEAARATLTPSCLERSIALARWAGNYVVAAGAVLGIAAIIHAAVKESSFTPVLPGLGLLVGLACAHYAARLAFAASDRLIETAPARTSATVVFDYVAVAALLGALFGVINAIAACIGNGNWRALIPAAIGAAYWIYFAGFTLQPATLRLTTERGSVGEDVVGLVAFVLKTLLKLAALPFFIYALSGSLRILLGFFGLDNFLPPFGAALPVSNILPMHFGSGLGGLGTLILACLMPVIMHVGFLVLLLPLDLWRALLAVPEKLDALKR